MADEVSEWATNYSQENTDANANGMAENNEDEERMETDSDSDEREQNNSIGTENDEQENSQILENSEQNIDNSMKLVPLDADGHPTYPLNSDGRPILPTNEKGQKVFPNGFDGNPLFPYDPTAQAPVFPVGEDGQPVFPVGKHGRPVVPSDANGKAVFPKGNDENYIFPSGSDGKPVAPVTVDGHPILPLDDEGKPVVPYDGNGEALIHLASDGITPLTKEEYQAQVEYEQQYQQYYQQMQQYYQQMYYNQAGYSTGANHGYAGYSSSSTGWQAIKASKKIRPEDIDLPTEPAPNRQFLPMEQLQSSYIGHEPLSGTKSRLKAQLKFSKKNLEVKLEKKEKSSDVKTKPVSKKKVAINFSTFDMEEYDDRKDPKIIQEPRKRRSRSRSRERERSNGHRRTDFSRDRRSDRRSEKERDYYRSGRNRRRNVDSSLHKHQSKSLSKSPDAKSPPPRKPDFTNKINRKMLDAEISNSMVNVNSINNERLEWSADIIAETSTVPTLKFSSRPDMADEFIQLRRQFETAGGARAAFVAFQSVEKRNQQLEVEEKARNAKGDEGRLIESNNRQDSESDKWKPVEKHILKLEDGEGNKKGQRKRKRELSPSLKDSNESLTKKREELDDLASLRHEALNSMENARKMLEEVDRRSMEMVGGKTQQTEHKHRKFSAGDERSDKSDSPRKKKKRNKKAKKKKSEKPSLYSSNDGSEEMDESLDEKKRKNTDDA